MSCDPICNIQLRWKKELRPRTFTTQSKQISRNHFLPEQLYQLEEWIECQALLQGLPERPNSWGWHALGVSRCDRPWWPLPPEHNVQEGRLVKSKTGDRQLQHRCNLHHLPVALMKSHTYWKHQNWQDMINQSINQVFVYWLHLWQERRGVYKSKNINMRNIIKNK